MRVGERGAAGSKIKEADLPFDWQIHGLIPSLKSVDETHYFVFLILKQKLEYSAK